MTTTAAFTVSPVNMADRTALGVQAGDTVRVHQKIQDKGKMRIQVFEGLVLAVKHGSEPGATFTVRKMVDGIGVEKIFPLFAPTIDKIEITRRSKVRRAKLYHIREKVAREARRQMRRMTMMSASTESGIEMEQKRVAEEAAKKAEEERLAQEAEAARVAAEAEATVAEPEAETPKEEEQKKEEAAA